MTADYFEETQGEALDHWTEPFPGTFAGLRDVEAMHAGSPSTFEIYSRERRSNLGIGDLAKLIFLTDGERGERMWVQVTGKTPSGRMTGRLDNVPTLLADLQYGDEVVFGAEHVADIIYGDA